MRPTEAISAKPDVVRRLKVVIPVVLLVFALPWWILRNMSVQAFWTQMLNGLSFAAVLFFLASGFTLIFGLMRITNLAHGGFYLVGGYLGITVMRITGHFPLAVLAGALGVAVLGLLAERGLLRRIRGNTQAEVLLTIGLTFMIGDISLAIWGGDPTPVPIPSILSGPLVIAGFFYPRYRLFVLVCAVVVAGVLFFLDRRTLVGALVRAGVDDREMISGLGTNIRIVFTAVFAFGALLAGFAGVIGGGFLAVVPGQEFEILLFALAVVIIGGLGSLPGAVLGAMFVGLIDAFAKAIIPELAYFTLFAPMAIILVLRPQGLMGRPV